MKEFHDKIKNIPIELRNKSRWVKYKIDKSSDGLKKRLLNPYNSQWARCDDSATWGSFEKAVMSVEQYGGDGVAFALGDNFFCIDIDKCIDKNGEYNELSAKLITEYSDTYIERSVSGQGVHIFGYGKISDVYMQKNEREGIECYFDARFICMTGDIISKNKELKVCNDQLIKTCEQYFKRVDKHVEAVNNNFFVSNSEKFKTNLKTESDSDLIERMFRSANGHRIRLLWDNNDKNNASSGDMSLCLFLAFWCKHDKAQMDRLFRRSGRMRDKWDEKHGKQTYGDLTICKACSYNNSIRSTQNKSFKNTNNNNLEDYK